MSTLSILGYGATVIMGVTLGILGGGGSILTMPILVYLFRTPATNAVPESLFLVAVTALAGSLPFIKRREFDGSAFLWFGLPSVGSIFLTRRYFVPVLPPEFGPVSKDQALLVLFGVVMLAAAGSMIGKRPEQSEHVHSPYKLLVQGVFVGVLAGLIGAGGGFLIVPALIRLARLQTRTAIGTSLAVIAANSSVGFFASKLPGAAEWVHQLVLAGLALTGALAGAVLGKSIPGERLRPAFGVFVLVMGLFVIGVEALK